MNTVKSDHQVSSLADVVSVSRPFRAASVTGYVTTTHSSYDRRYGSLLNLGLATSPIGPAPELREVLETWDPHEALSSYPSDPYQRRTHDIVLEGLGVREESAASVIFSGNGSYGAGDELVGYLHRHEEYRAILASSYSFPNVAQWAARTRMEYRPLPPALHPAVSLQHVLAIRPEELRKNILYVDYPNNPFGHADPDLLRRVVEHAATMEALPLVDLAFGEVLGDEFRAIIQYTLERGGICLGSLSKTQGLPGLRAGYAILPAALAQRYRELHLVFGLPSLSSALCQRLFKRGTEGKTLAHKHAERVARATMEINARLETALRQLGLEVACSDPRTPIQVVIASRERHFHQRLLQHGLLTESLRDYQVTLCGTPGYLDSAVRMRTPSPGQVEEVLRRVALAVAS